jgi:hypothetical protein
MATQPPPSSPSVKERKVSQSASCKIDCIINQLFLPMLGMSTPDHTSFQPEDDTVIIRQVAEECPAALQSEVEFVQYMVVLYRRFQAQNGDDCMVKNHHNNNHGDAKNTTSITTSITTIITPSANNKKKAGRSKAGKLPVQVVQDESDLPKALAHAVDAAAFVGEL